MGFVLEIGLWEFGWMDAHKIMMEWWWCQRQMQLDREKGNYLVSNRYLLHGRRDLRPQFIVPLLQVFSTDLQWIYNSFGWNINDALLKLLWIDKTMYVCPNRTVLYRKLRRLLLFNTCVRCMLHASRRRVGVILHISC